MYGFVLSFVASFAIVEVLMKKILEILEQNARESYANIATQLGISVNKVKNAVKKAEADRAILKYHTIIDWSKVDSEKVWALIEVRLTPQQDVGFEVLAERIYSFPQVYSAYLVSGTYDLALIVRGEDMHEIASFVTTKLAPIEKVQSTVTHFLLKRYKDSGAVLGKSERVKRLPISL